MAVWEGGKGGDITPGFYFINSEKRMDSTENSFCYVMLKNNLSS